MSITTTEVMRERAGHRWHVILKGVDSGAATADEMASGLGRIDVVIPMVKNDVTPPKVNESFPLAGGDITVTANSASDEFYLLVIGV